MWVEGVVICISWVVVKVPSRDSSWVCIVFTSICCFLFHFLNLGNALLCYEVVCKCVIEYGVLARCDVFLVGARRLV